MTKQLFHALINRSQAYEYSNQLGLITFGSEVSRVCELMPLYERFRAEIDRVDTDGDTKVSVVRARAPPPPHA